MSTTLPEIFKEPTFGNLVTLPSVYELNSGLVARAKEQCNPVLKNLPLDLTKPTPEELEALDSELNGLQVKLAAAVKVNQERRMVFTGYFDKIKSVFTGMEADLTALKDGFKVTRDGIAKERIRRQAAEQKKQDDLIQKKQELVMLRTNWTQSFNANFSRALAEQIAKLNENFNGKLADQLEAYGVTLKAWNPAYKAHDIICAPVDSIQWRFNDSGVAEKNFTEVRSELFEQFNERYVKIMFTERDRLIELIPSRIKELKESDAKTIAARLEKEKKDAQDKLDLELRQQSEQIAAQGEADVLNATFEVAAKAEMPIEQTKGAVRKMKYVCESHAAYIAIIQSWVANDLPTLTIDELNKKLSFMLTSGNKRLNEGVKLEAKGLAVIEDISTRTSKIK